MNGRLTVLLLAGAACLAACNRPTSPAPAPGTAAPTAAAANTLQIEEVRPGDGAVATKGQVVSIHYTGWLPDGTKFDTTVDRQPLQFQLGQGHVLKGWDLGVEGMKVGGKRKLTVPPQLAFGDREVASIKKGSTLVFDVELVKVQ